MEGYLGEIRLVALVRLPENWAYCNGQLLPLSQYAALYSLIGNIYGGDGSSNFALPNLQSRVPIHVGTGQGLSTYQLGQNGGYEGVGLLPTQVPLHTHPYAMQVDNIQGQTSDATNGHIAQVHNSQAGQTYESFTTGAPNNPVSLASQMTGPNPGGGAPHANIQPYLALNYIICLEGIYPSFP